MQACSLRPRGGNLSSMGMFHEICQNIFSFWKNPVIKPPAPRHTYCFTVLCCSLGKNKSARPVVLLKRGILLSHLLFPWLEKTLSVDPQPIRA